MKAGSFGRRIASVVAAVLLFTFLSVLFIPDRVLLETINRGLAGQGLKLTPAAFHKAIPLGLAGTGWNISSEKGNLISFDKLRVRLHVLPLFAGRIQLSAEGTAGAGNLNMAMELSRSGRLSFAAKNVRLELVPFIATVTGAQAAGILSCQAEISGLKAKSEGHIKLEAQGVDLKGVRIGETPLPDASYRTVQGMLRVNGGVATIESFTLQGDGLYARLKGKIPPGSPLSAVPLDLSLELMPKPEFLEKQKLIFLLLLKYQDTPGHYLLPIKGTLGKPQLE